jgi:hypothetical protein
MTEAKALFAAFESLGEDAEFGVVQRQAGVDTPGLFQFAYTPYLPALTAAIESGFASFGQSGDFCLLIGPGGNFEAYSRDFRTSYATPIRWGAQEPQVVAQDLSTRLALLKSKFLGELAVASKIYVRKGSSDDLSQILALGRGLRRFGPNTLLWVVAADEDHPPGTAELMSVGVIVGRVSKIPSGEEMPETVFSEWVALCEQCLAIGQTQKGLP